MRRVKSAGVAGELSSDTSQKCLVAVKLLKDETSSESRRDFCQEVKVMASFHHENILHLIGIVPIGASRTYVLVRVGLAGL